MLKLFNFLILQWFCVRLVRCTRKVYTFRGSAVCSSEYYISQWYSLAGWVVPLTGWKLFNAHDISGTTYFNASFMTFGTTKRCGSIFPWLWRITWRRKLGVYNSKQV